MPLGLNKPGFNTLALLCALMRFVLLGGCALRSCAVVLCAATRLDRRVTRSW